MDYNVPQTGVLAPIVLDGSKASHHPQIASLMGLGLLPWQQGVETPKRLDITISLYLKNV